MTRTSTEPRTDEAPSNRSFVRTFAVTIAVLALLCAGLVAVAHSQGPRLSETIVDGRAVTLRADQQARVFLDESVATVRAEQVAVSPAARFAVTTQGTVVAVQFLHRLDYDTRYRVTIRGVTSVFGSRAATISTEFTTGRAQVLTLDRNPAGQDRIVRASVNAVGRSVVYQARRIQAYAPIGSDLVVVSDDRRTSRITVVSSDGTTEDLLLPGPGLVTGFALDAPTGVLVFRFTARGAATKLYTISLTGVHTSAPYEGSTLPADDASQGAAPSLAADSRSVVVSGRTVYTATKGARLSQLGSSPNGQFVTVVSAPASAASDRSTIDPAPVGATTLVVDRSSGAVVASFAGSSLRWG